VLLASHHGRRSGYFEAAVQAISHSSSAPGRSPQPTTRTACTARVLAGNFYSTRTHGTICIGFIYAYESGEIEAGR
jgi:hypothetical protein